MGLPRPDKGRSLPSTRTSSRSILRARSRIALCHPLRCLITGANSRTRCPTKRVSTSSTISSGLADRVGSSQLLQSCRPTLANSSLRYGVISVRLATVDMLRPRVRRWATAMVGGTPRRASTSGPVNCFMYCRANGDRQSRKRRWPSACKISNTTEDLPDPLGPVSTTRRSRRMSRSRSLRL